MGKAISIKSSYVGSKLKIFQKRASGPLITSKNNKSMGSLTGEKMIQVSLTKNNIKTQMK